MLKSKKPALQRAKELSDDAVLEEGDHWFAVATPWWEEFQACRKAKDAPSVRNDSLIDKQLSSKTRKVAVLKPKLEEGSDFVFVPEASWEVIARELDFDWDIRREVVYQRSQQELQIEPYPFAFKVIYWTSEATESEELVDGAGRVVVVLGSRAHTLGQLLSEIWLAAPDDFRRKFPQFLNAIDPICSSVTSSTDSQIRSCYRTRRASDGQTVWVPLEKMLKRPRAVPTSLRLKPRAKKRQAREEEESSDDQQSDDDSEVEYDEHSEQLQGDRSGLTETMSLKLGDLRLDNRSEVASGAKRLHELLVEQKAQGDGDVGWPSQGIELQWRMSLAKGDTLDALDTSRSWFEARLLAARRLKVHVHYRSWESKWDEWIFRASPRIAPPYSRVSRWRSALRPHSLVQVGLQVPRLRHTKWRNATVIEVVPSTDGGPEQPQGGDGDGVGLRVHVQVDSDDIWLPAHDDLLCRSNTHYESSALTQSERQLLAHDDSLASDSSETAEQLTVDMDDEDHGAADGDGSVDGGTINLMEIQGSPLRPPRATNAAVGVTTTSRSRLDLRAPVRPARDLSASFSQVQDQGPSSAGRTPARRRGRSRSRSQVSDDDTSPEPVSPAPISRAGRPNSRELQTLWAQVGNGLRALQSSWSQLGEGLISSVETQERTQD